MNNPQVKKVPQFSIIIPVYNMAIYIDRCLDSVEKQTYANFEAIIIDDGSTDSSLAIVKKYALRDPRFRVFHQDNQGSSETYNRCITKSKGKYIVSLDADDWLDSHLLERVSQALQLYPNLDYISFGCQFFNQDGTKGRFFNGTKQNIYCKNYDEMISVFKSIDPGIALTHTSKAIKRDLFDGIRFNGPGRGADCHVFSLLCLKSKTAYFLGETLYHALIRENESQSRKPISQEEYSIYATRTAQYLPQYLVLSQGHSLPLFSARSFQDHFKNACIFSSNKKTNRQNAKLYWKHRDIFLPKKATVRFSFCLWCLFPNIVGSLMARKITRKTS